MPVGPHRNLVDYVERGTSRAAFQLALAAHVEDCKVEEEKVDASH